MRKSPGQRPGQEGGLSIGQLIHQTYSPCKTLAMFAEQKANFLLVTNYCHSYLNKRAQRALGRSPEEKVKGQSEAIIL